MVGARERPDIAFEFGKKLDDDLFGGLRDEVALGHFHFVASERACAGEEMIASTCGENKKVSFVPLIVDGITRLVEGGVYVQDARVVDAATGFAGAVEKQAV